MKRLFNLVLSITILIQVSYAQWATSGTHIYNANAGSVGIGTTTPAYKLDVNGSIRSSGDAAGVAYWIADGRAIRNTNTANGTGAVYFDASNLYIRRADNGMGLLSVLSNGNVGVGDITPLTPLHVGGIGSFGSSITSLNATRALNLADANAVMRILRVHGTNAPAVELISRASPDGANVAYWDFYAQPSDASFRIRDRVGGGNGLDRFTISSSGDVGIGTITPQQRLHVEGTLNQAIFVSTTTLGSTSGSGMIGAAKALPTGTDQRLGYFLMGSRGGAQNGYNSAGMAAYASSAWTAGTSHPTYLAFETTASGSASRAERMRIGDNGNVGIGTTNPIYKLHSVSLGNTGTAAALIHGQYYGLAVSTQSSSASHYVFDVTSGRDQNGSGGTSKFLVRADGNVGIGTTSPSEKMEISGRSYFNAEDGGVIIDANGHKRVGFMKYIGREAGIWRIAGQAFEIGRTNTTTLATTPSSFATDFYIGGNGNVGIGTIQINDNNYSLFVEKGIRTRKIKVDQTAWPDYVFESTYQLPTLQEVEAFIKEHKHLPGVPSAKEVENDGLDVGDNQATLLKKIEELTLYMIELKKKLDEQATEIAGLKKKLAEK